MPVGFAGVVHGIGLQQGVYSFGVAIKSTQWIYEIYDTLLYKWIEERSVERSEPA